MIVDDHPIVIQGMKMMLAAEKSFHISATFLEGAGLVQHIKHHAPDIILLDVSLPDFSGIELCSEIKKALPETAVLMFSNRSERSIILQSLQNGASGYILKNASMAELRACILGAVSGQVVFCGEVLKIMQKPSAREISPIPRLTKREKEILLHLSQGLTSNQIAEKLFLSPLTVDTHRKNLHQKFGTHNSTEMIRVALEFGLV